MGSSKLDDMKGIIVDNALNVYPAGHFTDTANFTPEQVQETRIGSLGAFDIFLYKLNQKCPPDSLITASSCGAYTLNGQTYAESGTYTQIYPTKEGCDSTLILTLTIKISYNDTIAKTTCSSFTLNAVQYDSTGIYTQAYTNAAGCDSLVILNLIVTPVNTGVDQLGKVLTAAATAATYQWINCADKTPIAGAVNNVYTATENGQYAVVLTQGECTDTSECYTVSGIVGIAQNHIATTINIYPNPNNGQLTITAGVPLKGGSIRLIDLLGQTVLVQQQLNGTIFPIDLTQFASGIYFLEISEAGISNTFKLIKE